MPLYDYVCEAGHRFERVVPLACYNEEQDCECGAAAEKLVSAPRVFSDCIDPIRGADGKMHDSMKSYRHSLTPEGNPQGERYHIVGDDQLPSYSPPKFDKAKRRDDIKRSIADVKYGRVPPPKVVVGDSYD